MALLPLVQQARKSLFLNEYKVLLAVRLGCEGPKMVRTSYVGIYAAPGPLVFLLIWPAGQEHLQRISVFLIAISVDLTGTSSRFLGGQDSLWSLSSLILHQEVRPCRA